MSETSYPREAWVRLGREVRRRRIGLDMNQPDVSAAGGPSTGVISKIENARQTHYEDRVLALLERALRWQPGSCKRVLDGGDPVELGEPTSVTVQGKAGAAIVRGGQGSVKADNGIDLVSLRERAQAEGRTIGELLVEGGLVVPEELVVPDALPPDPIIEEINASDISEETKRKIIRIHLENRARRFEEARLESKKPDS